MDQENGWWFMMIKMNVDVIESWFKMVFVIDDGGWWLRLVVGDDLAKKHMRFRYKRAHMSVRVEIPSYSLTNVCPFHVEQCLVLIRTCNHDFVPWFPEKKNIVFFPLSTTINHHQPWLTISNQDYSPLFIIMNHFKWLTRSSILIQYGF